MSDILLAHEPMIRGSAFAFILLAMAQETDSYFRFNLPWWDRLFGTYRDQPAGGHLGMTIDIEDFREAHDLRLDRMLLQPFVNPPRDVKRQWL